MHKGDSDELVTKLEHVDEEGDMLEVLIVKGSGALFIIGGAEGVSVSVDSDALKFLFRNLREHLGES